MRRMLLIGLFLLGSILFVIPATGQDNAAFLRLAHYVPDAPAFDVYVDGQISDLRSILYKNPSDWITVPAGSHELAVTTTGGDLDDILFTLKSYDLTAGSWTTIFVAGSAARNTLAHSVVTEDYGNIPEGQARITVFHGIQGAVPVNLLASSVIQVDTLAFPGAAGSNDGASTIDLPAGNYTDIQIVRSDNSNRLLELPATDLESGKYYLIAATGLADLSIEIDFHSTDVAAVLSEAATPTQTSTPEAAFLRGVHLSPDAAKFDIYVDGQLSAVAGLTNGNISDWAKLAPGTHDIAIAISGGNLNAAFFTQSVEIPAGAFATILFTDATSNEEVNINILVEDYSHIPADRGRATIVHAVRSAPPINFYLGENALLIESLAFPGSIGDNDGAATVDITAGTYDIAITASGDSRNVLLDLPGIEISPDTYYLIAATGTADNLSSVIIPTDMTTLMAGSAP